MAHSIFLSCLFVSSVPFLFVSSVSFSRFIQEHLSIDCAKWTNGDAVSSNRSHVKRLKDSYFKYEPDWILVLRFSFADHNAPFRRRCPREFAKRNKFWSVRVGHPVCRAVHQLIDHGVQSRINMVLTYMLECNNASNNACATVVTLWQMRRTV